ncbi:MAG: hypothetical protein AB1668_03445 [Nanoarchaeota archaeon]
MSIDLERSLPGIIREILYAQSEILGIATEPFPITNETLCRCYTSLQKAAQNYPYIAAEQKPQFREDNCYCLRFTEFQAGWHVLRVTSHNDADISRMPDDVRNNLFLCELYTHPALFPFFHPRETAITVLEGIGFIDAGNYRGVV